jgi:hypothetical protein
VEGCRGVLIVKYVNVPDVTTASIDDPLRPSSVVVGFETEARTRGVIRAASPLDTPLDRGREAPSADSK